MICVIDRKGTSLEYRSGCLVVRQKGKKSSTIPINQLEQVVVYGNPLVQTAVWRNLADASIPVVMLSSRGREQAAMLGSGLAVRLPLRRLQHRLADNPEAEVAMARWFIQRKFQSYTLALVALKAGFKPDHSAIENFLERRERAELLLSKADSVAGIMGREGSLANDWFKLLTAALPAHLRFSGRNRRPPQDPVNSLLSLGYTLLLSEVRQTILMEGLDPSLGFLHQDYPGRESLALDFMEIFRTGVDDFVLRWITSSSLDSSSFFYRKENGCRLSKSIRPLYFQAWAEQREAWPRFDSTGERGQRRPIRELLLGQTARARKRLTKLEQLYA